MKTLYVSDLDGTLLRSDETTSEYTNSVINNLTDRGMIFSYATARSLITAKKVTSGLRAEIPLIVYNGAFIVDNVPENVKIIDLAQDFRLAPETVVATQQPTPAAHDFVYGLPEINESKIAVAQHGAAALLWHPLPEGRCHPKSNHLFG